MFFSLHSNTCNISSLFFFVRMGFCPTENRRAFCRGGFCPGLLKYAHGSSTFLLLIVPNWPHNAADQTLSICCSQVQKVPKSFAFQQRGHHSIGTVPFQALTNLSPPYPLTFAKSKQ